jgi:integrase
MAHKANGRGCFRIDRIFPAVGRIAVSSGTKSRTEFRKRNELVTSLYDTGRLDLLEAIKDGRFTVAEVFSAQRTERLGFLAADIVLHRNLWEVFEEWKYVSANMAKTRLRYQTSFRALRRSGILKDDSKVRDLNRVNWTELRELWSNSAADWNHLRRAVSRFLTMILKDKYHPFRRAVMDAFPKASEPPGRVPDLSPELFWKLVDAAAEQIRPALVTLVATGMRVGEYLACQREDLRPHTYTLRVPGTKTPGSEDIARIDPSIWPWVNAAIPAPMQYKWLRIHFKRACATIGVEDLRLHDLRHCTGQWLTDAGRPEASVQQTLRHKDPSMTRRYTKQRMKGEDAAALAKVLQPAGPRVAVV